jgi:L-seryl-tRNA(Ser) seleniumtransferase
MNNAADDGRATIPSVDKVLRSDECKELTEIYGRKRVTETVRRHLIRLRDNINDADSVTDISEIVAAAAIALAGDPDHELCPVFNLTGTVLHTNLGRSILPDEALEAVVLSAKNSSNLEYDLDSGQRGDRDSHTEKLICDITGAEAATLVNNNAAAVLLVLNSLALKGEVPVSRGELVEIGGSFRVPDIMSRAGCSLVEIGTTNRTHARDYTNAISKNTALLMKVHTSNYQIKGFTNTVSDTEVASIAHEHGLPFVTDLGSGTLIDLEKFGLPWEPTVQETLRNGADIVTFSGDKLLGGPQAGIIAGNRELIQNIKSNPLKRALRVDKMTIAAMYAVLNLYRDPDRLKYRLPTLRMLSREVGEIENLGQLLLPIFNDRYSGIAKASLIDCASQIGSGSMPLDLLPSKAIELIPLAEKGRDKQLNDILRQLRALPMPVIGRITNGAVVLDLRCLEETDQFIAQLKQMGTGKAK